MDRQLKQAAFFGTERRSRFLERHYKTPGMQALSCHAIRRWNKLEAGQSPNRDGSRVRQEAEHTLVVGLGGMSVKRESGLRDANIQAIGDPGYAPSSNPDQSKLCRHLLIVKLVQFVLQPRARRGSVLGKPIEPHAATLQCQAYRSGVHPPKGDNKLHWSSVLLHFNVAAQDGLRNGSDRSGAAAAAPKRRLRGAERGAALLAQCATGALLVI